MANSSVGANSRLRVIFSSLHYWPEHTGNAPYTTGLAELLCERGHSVNVLTGMPFYPEWRVHAEYSSRIQMTETRHGVTINRIRQYVPARQTAARRAMVEGSFLFHLPRLVAPKRPDMAVGVMPTVSGGLIAQAASKRYAIPYLLWVQDISTLGARQTHIRGGTGAATIAQKMESYALRHAHGVAIVSESFRPHLEAMGVAPERITHIPNWSHVQPPTADREATRRRLGWGAREQIVLHAGNMGLKQGLEHVVRAAQVASSRRLPIRFVLLGDGNQRRHLESLAQDCDAVSFLDPVPADEFMNVLAAADILLVNERATVVDMSLPSKLTSYFVAGRPIIAAVNQAGATARELLRSEAGLTVPAEDANALISTISDLASDTERVQSLAAAGPRYAATHLSADAAIDRFEQFFDEIIVRHQQTAGKQRVFSLFPHRANEAAGKASPALTAKDGQLHG